METLLKNTPTIYATSFGYEIRPGANSFRVLFNALDGTNIGPVVGMIIPSGKDALNAYNRMFKGKQFCITINVKGIVCEGMRWNDDKWTEVPKSIEQVFLQTTNRLRLRSRMNLNAGIQDPKDGLWKHRLSKPHCTVSLELMDPSIASDVKAFLKNARVLG